MSDENRPLVAHIIHRFGVGGLENGLVNLLNNFPVTRYRHVVICLTESSGFSNRIRHDDVEIYELHKQNGKDPGLYFRLWKLLIKLRPEIVHSRNLAALEASVVAKFAGVPIRIHGEHGRDIYDLQGNNKKYQWLRRFCSPFIDCFITMSKDLESWLIDEVKITKSKVVQLYNGVDSRLFSPTSAKELDRVNLLPDSFANNTLLIGTVGRLEPVKDQITLVKAFIQLLEMTPNSNKKLCLIILGDGVLREQIEQIITSSGAANSVWLAGSREDVSEILPLLDIFVLPSLGEGISNTILEAMSCALPVVATSVGGNPELVIDGETGTLVPPDSPEAMAKALKHYVDNESIQDLHGLAGRHRVEETFSLNSMVERYMSVYDRWLEAKVTWKK